MFLEDIKKGFSKLYLSLADDHKLDDKNFDAFNDLISQLQSYADAENEGRIKKFPCRLGTMAYAIIYNGSDWELSQIEIMDLSSSGKILCEINGSVAWRDFGVSDNYIYYDKEEAEYRLNELRYNKYLEALDYWKIQYKEIDLNDEYRTNLCLEYLDTTIYALTQVCDKLKEKESELREEYYD